MVRKTHGKKTKGGKEFKHVRANIVISLVSI